MNLSTPQYVLPVYLCRFAVRVPPGLCLADFLGSMVTHAIDPPEGGSILSRSALMVDLPAMINAYALQRGLPSPRGGVTAPSPRRPRRQ